MDLACELDAVGGPARAGIKSISKASLAATRSKASELWRIRVRRDRRKRLVTEIAACSVDRTDACVQIVSIYIAVAAYGLCTMQTGGDADMPWLPQNRATQHAGKSSERRWRRVVLHLFKDSEQVDDEVDTVRGQAESNEANEGQLAFAN